MANVKFTFLGTERSGTSETELECFTTIQNEILISIDSGVDNFESICLDKSTAIRFAKTLRTEINKIQEGAKDGWQKE